MRQYMLLLVLFSVCAGTARSQDIPRPVRILEYPADSVVGLSQDMSHILVVTPEQAITLYDTWGTVLHTAQHEGDPIQRIAWHPDLPYALLVAYQSLYQIDLETAAIREIATFPDLRLIVATYFDEAFAIVAHTGRDIGSAYVDIETYVWDGTTLAQTLYLPPTESCLPQIQPEAAEYGAFLRSESYYSPCARHLDWNPDQSQYMRWVFWNSGDPAPIKLYDSTTHDLLFELRHCLASEATQTDCALASLSHVAWSPDGKILVSLPENGANGVNVWDASTGTLLHSLALPGSNSQYPHEVKFSADSQRLAVLADLGTLLIWETASGRLLQELYFAESVMQGAQWLYDDQMIIAWGDGTPWSTAIGAIWDTTTGAKLALLPSPGTTLRQVVTAPEQQWLALVYGNQLELYDLAYQAEHWFQASVR